MSKTMLSAEEKQAVLSAERQVLTRLLQSALAGDMLLLRQTVQDYLNAPSPTDEANDYYYGSGPVVQVLMLFKDGKGRTALHFACQNQPTNDASRDDIRGSREEKTHRAERKVQASCQNDNNNNNNEKDGKEEDPDIVEQILEYIQETPASASSSGPPASLEQQQQLWQWRQEFIRIKDKDGLTPLMLAAQHSQPSVAQRRVLALLAAAATPPPTPTTTTNTFNKLGLARSQAGATALHYAAGAGATARTIQALVQAGPLALSTSSRQGGTPLHWACAGTHTTTTTTTTTHKSRVDVTETMGALLDAGADINACSGSSPAAASSIPSSSPSTPLLPPPLALALAAGQERPALFLLQQARQRQLDLTPTLTFRLPGHITVFHMAADLNMVACLGQLLEFEQEIAARTTAPVVHSVTEHPNVDDDDDDDPTAQGETQHVDLHQVQNEEGLTPLDLAVRGEHVDCVLLLMMMMARRNLHPDDATQGPLTEQDALELIRQMKRDRPELLQESTSSLSLSSATSKPKSATGRDQQDKDTPTQSVSDEIKGAAQAYVSSLLAAHELNQDTETKEQAQKKAQAQKELGNESFKNEDYRGAISFYDQAIALDPTQAALYSNRSACHLKLATLAATKPLSTSNNYDDDHHDSVNQNGENATIATQHDEEARAALLDGWICRCLQPEWPKGAYRVAQAHMALGLYEEAAVSAWEGLQQDQENHELKQLLHQCVQKGRARHIEDKKANKRTQKRP